MRGVQSGEKHFQSSMSSPSVRQPGTQTHTCLTHSHQLYYHGQDLTVCKILTLILIKRDFLQRRYCRCVLPCCVNAACAWCVSVCVYAEEPDDMVLHYFSSRIRQSIQLQLDAMLLLTDGSETAGSACLSAVQKLSMHIAL